MGLDSWSGQILVGLVSEVLGALVLGSVAVVGYLRFRRGKRQQLEAFFGLEGGREGSVHIFLSNIYVQAGGTVGVTHIDDGFTGSALTEGEYISALELADEIEEGPFRGLSRLLRGFFRTSGSSPRVSARSPWLPLVLESEVTSAGQDSHPPRVKGN